MSRTSQAGSWGLMIAMAGTAAGADDGPPPLTLPAEVPVQAPAPAATSPKPAPRDPLRPSTNLLRPRPSPARPVVVPTPPANQVSPFAIPAPVVPSSPPDIPVFPDAPPSLEPAEPAAEIPELDAPPPLDGPAEMRVAPERRPRASTSTSAISTRRVGAAPRPRDEVRDEPVDDAPPSLVLEPAPSADQGFEPLPDGPPGTGDRSLNRELDRIEPELPDKPKPPSSGRRRFGLFGAPASSRDREPESPDPMIKVEPRSDPAADASLKRKLEAKIKDAVGNRADDIEVRVVDRNIVIKAHVDRFWNRRGVRRTIENLPALSGYKARIDIDD